MKSLSVIFRGNVLLPLVFVIATMSLNFIRRQQIYKITRSTILCALTILIYLTEIKKKPKKTGDPETNIKNIQSGYRDDIWLWEVSHADNETWPKRNYWRNRTAKLGKHQHTWREGMFEGLENIESENYWTSKKKILHKNKKTSLKQSLQQKFH